MKIQKLEEGFTAQTTLRTVLEKVASMLIPDFDPNKKYSLHHIDDDHTNYELSNLALMQTDDHNSYNGKYAHDKGFDRTPYQGKIIRIGEVLATNLWNQGSLDKDKYGIKKMKIIKEGKYLATFHNGPTGNGNRQEVFVDADSLNDAMDKAQRLPQAKSRRYSNLTVTEYKDGKKAFGCEIKTSSFWDGEPDGRYNDGTIRVFVNADDEYEVRNWVRKNVLGKYINDIQFRQTPFSNNKDKQWFFDTPKKQGRDTRADSIRNIYYIGGSDSNYTTIDESLTEDKEMNEKKTQLTEELSPEEAGASGLFNDLIQREYEQLNQYDSVQITLEDQGDDRFSEILEYIKDDLNIHIGMLQSCLDDITGSGEQVDQGEAQADQVLGEGIEKSDKMSLDESLFEGWYDEPAVYDYPDELIHKTYDFAQELDPYDFEDSFDEWVEKICEVHPDDITKQTQEELDGLNAKEDSPELYKLGKDIIRLAQEFKKSIGME